MPITNKGIKLEGFFNADEFRYNCFRVAVEASLLVIVASFLAFGFEVRIMLLVSYPLVAVGAPIPGSVVKRFSFVLIDGLLVEEVWFGKSFVAVTFASKLSSIGRVAEV
mmetsp:Transcript_30556/g.61929  ORF Transcript_30556/g.61929 Transcript_30556/m.61929 type:complete len:109 (+) Transcript_30556:86-412(+)